MVLSCLRRFVSIGYGCIIFLVFGTSFLPFAAPFSSSNNKQLNIAFVTGNEMKAMEVKMILDTHVVARNLVNLRVLQVDLPEIQEVNTQAIAKEKALLGAQLAGGPCVVEDTSLKFEALGGMPGKQSTKLSLCCMRICYTTFSFC